MQAMGSGTLHMEACMNKDTGCTIAVDSSSWVSIIFIPREPLKNPFDGTYMARASLLWSQTLPVATNPEEYALGHKWYMRTTYSSNWSTVGTILLGPCAKFHNLLDRAKSTV